jgi:hypothetical protein
LIADVDSSNTYWRFSPLGYAYAAERDSVNGRCCD